jgi:hypothetical protein
VSNKVSEKKHFAWIAIAEHLQSTSIHPWPYYCLSIEWGAGCWDGHLHVYKVQRNIIEDVCPCLENISKESTYHVF